MWTRNKQSECRPPRSLSTSKIGQNLSDLNATRICHLILRLVMIGIFAHVEALWHSFHCFTVCLGTNWVALQNNRRRFWSWPVSELNDRSSYRSFVVISQTISLVSQERLSLGVGTSAFIMCNHAIWWVVVLTIGSGVSHHTPPLPGGSDISNNFNISVYFYNN